MADCVGIWWRNESYHVAVCVGILKIALLSHLWLEKEIKSVANVTRKDIGEFLELAAEIPIRPEVQEFTLADANQALIELKEANIRGAKVLRMI